VAKERRPSAGDDVTFEDRQRVKAAINDRQRALVKRAPFAYACAGCGRDRAGCNPACPTCRDRRRARWKRELERAS
jgi:hypothetical protein